MCGHVVHFTRSVAAANPAFARMIGRDLPGSNGAEAEPRLLLSEWDLRLIEAAAAFARVRHLWGPDLVAYERWSDGLADVRRYLGESYAAAWHDCSVDAIDCLTDDVRGPTRVPPAGRPRSARRGRG